MPQKERQSLFRLILPEPNTVPVKYNNNTYNNIQDVIRRSKKLRLNDWTVQCTENLVKLLKHNDEAL